MKKQLNILFWLITAALFIGMVFPDLFSDGMFMDGLIYANISRNLAEGSGSFWDLHLSKTVFPHFHEHPPLAMGLESLLFKLFGDSIFTERIYSLLTALVTGFVIVLIWKKVVPKKYHSFSWLPILFWINFPIISWSVENNMLENTMMIFTALSVLFILKSTEKNSYLNLIISGFLLFLGFLSKGFVSLFPLSLPFFLWLINKKISFRHCVVYTLVMTAAFILPFIFLYMFMPEGFLSIQTYIETQVIGSIENIQTVNSRFAILGHFALQLSPIIMFMLLILFISKRKKTDLKISIRKDYSMCLFFLSLAGVIPMMISLKQRAFYISAALPFAALSLAVYIAPYINFLYEKFTQKKRKFMTLKIITGLLLLISMIYSAAMFNKTGRDKELISDVQKIIDIVPENSIISSGKNEFDNWSLQNYLNRYAHICLDNDQKKYHQFYLHAKESETVLPGDFTKIGLNMKRYNLYRKKSKN